MPIAHNLGFPHLGAARELKRATEGYWGGKVSLPDLLKTGAELRARHWRLQQDARIDLLPSDDLSYYHPMLHTRAPVGAAPQRHRRGGGAGANATPLPVGRPAPAVLGGGLAALARGGGGGGPAARAVPGPRPHPRRARSVRARLSVPRGTGAEAEDPRRHLLRGARR